MILRAFTKDETGSMTLWMLMWSVIFIGFAGLAIDVANLYRTRAMLSATADAASHAGAIALATGGNVGAAVTSMANVNMSPSTAGGASVVDATDGNQVFVGVWDPVARKITKTSTNPDAVYVLARRTEATNNAVETSLLRILDFNTWNVSVPSVSVAAKNTKTPCGAAYPNALVSAGQISFSSNNTFAGQLCVHGQEGIEGQQNNISVGEGVLFTMPNAYLDSEGGMFDVAECLKVPAFGEDPIGNCNRAQGNDLPWAAESGHLLTLTSDLFADPTGSTADPDDYFGFQAAYDAANPTTDNYKAVTNGNGQSAYTATMFTADMASGVTHFRINCTNSNNTFDVGSGQVMNGITIVTNCKFSTPSSAVANNVTIISSATDGMVTRDTDPNSPTFGQQIDELNGRAVSFAASAGTGGSCGDPDHRLRIYTPGGVQLAGQANFASLEMYVGGDFQFAAQGTVTANLNAYVWGDVNYTSLADLIPCVPTLIGTGDDNPFNQAIEVNIVG